MRPRIRSMMWNIRKKKSEQQAEKRIRKKQGQAKKLLEQLQTPTFESGVLGGEENSVSAGSE